MKTKTKILLTCLLGSVFLSNVNAQPSPVAVKKPATPEALKAGIEALKPAQLAWREIQWKTCLLEAFAESRAKKKPVFLWVVGQGEGLGRL